MSEKTLTFQQVIMRLQQFWSEYGCLIWQPYSEKVGAGTMNPATALRVLGPEPWNVAYVEPSYRADDGRYGQNPNRMQMFLQYQVILKPDPGNPQELYLQSLEAIGIKRRQHDIRFVEDNWKAPALGAWGLGWEVWLDGMEITQFTYFQQSGGFPLDPVAVELTYGLERIVMYLQGVRSVWEIDWDGQRTYGQVLLPQEIEHCKYNFDHADVERLKQMYNLFEAEAQNALVANLVTPAHDYVLRCSHTFNVLDARGAIGVTERASYFARMRDLSRQVAEAYVAQREQLGFPFLKHEPVSRLTSHVSRLDLQPETSKPETFLLEIGTEELPAGDLATALAQLRKAVPKLLKELRLEHGNIQVTGTPRRLVVFVEELATRQRNEEQEVKGPPASAAFDAEGRPTRAAEGFARSQGVRVEELQLRSTPKGEWVFAMRREPGRPAAEVLRDALPQLIASLRFDMNMRWNQTNVAFSRPIRWFVSLHGEQLIPFEYAGVVSGRTTRGLRPLGSPAIELTQAGDYWQAMTDSGIVVRRDERWESVRSQVDALASEVEGVIADDPALLDEVTDLVEQPVALRGRFDPDYLRLPKDVLITVMKKHQRYFAVVNDQTGELMPHFIAVCNGKPSHPDIVRTGYEEVLRARYADATFFYEADTVKPLETFTPRLATLTFQERLGSMLDKVKRLEKLMPVLAKRLGLTAEERATALRAATLCKSDLATQMVVELTSLQGVMGREYGLTSGETEEVAQAIFEHYLPRSAGDRLPERKPGLVVGLANRLDSLAGLFSVGLAPTGSADPYHLRRDALGIVQNLIHAQLSLPLREALAEAAALLPVEAGDAILDQVLTFIRDRFYGWLRHRGLPHDVVEAVLAERGDDPYRAYTAAQELACWVEQEDWNEVLVAYARCKRIVRPLAERFELAPEHYVEPATCDLHGAWEAVRPTISPDGRVDPLGEALRTLVAPINRFFDEVLVMAEEPELRAARLALVQQIAALPDGIADLGKLQGF